MSTVGSFGSPSTPVVPPLPIHKFSVQKYEEMIQKGVLTEDDDVELLEGWIVPKMSRTPEHDGIIVLAEFVLRPFIPLGLHIRTQCAITTSDSRPEPDLAIVAGDRRDYISRLPGPSDIGLLIEVAESSLKTDRVDKGRIYARANIPAYWIVNLVDRQVEVYGDPDPQAVPPTYRSCDIFVAGQSLPLALKGASLAQVRVDDLIP